MIDVGLASYAVAAVGYALLAALLLRQWQSLVGPAVLASCILTCVWASVVSLGTLAEYPPILLIQSCELARDVAWITLLLQLNSLQSGEESLSFAGWHWPRAVSIGAASVLGLIWLKPALEVVGLPSPSFLHDLQLALWLVIAVAALLLVEQLYRNANPIGRWSSKFICLGIGAIFLYDFFMYAEALLFRQLDAELWRARGIVMAVAVPWLAVGLARQQTSQIDLHISRQVVFHSVTLVAAGLYLLCMALIGYYIQYRGGDWGGVLQVGFSAGALALLLSVLFSGRVRANLRVQLNKHFFSYRYDYREEWLKFTAALAELSDDVPAGIIEIMAPLVGSPAGLLFTAQQDSFPCIANFEMPKPDGDLGVGNVPAWMIRTGWVIDLNEWREQRPLYGDLEIPDWVLENPDYWLLVPLVFRDHVVGIVLLKRAELKKGLNWEDRDLLKTAGRQAATHLSQHLASQALVEARQFDAFNRLSAYVVHDLKNILAQQSLMVSNADRHKHNPAFVDDMIGTIANSVQRMQRLMDQMRSGIRDLPAARVSLASMLAEIVHERSVAEPIPQFDDRERECHTLADRERLSTVFTHLVQNAQDATDTAGTVTLDLQCDSRWVTVTIRDSGCGMSPEFLRNRLFKPFDSTKGLTGMGIGAFESREYVRQLGGDIQVESVLGEGSLFTITLPIAVVTAGADISQEIPADTVVEE